MVKPDEKMNILKKAFLLILLLFLISSPVMADSTEQVTITTDTMTIIRGNDLSVTVEGKPDTYYFVWFSGTNSFTFGNGPGDITTEDIPPQFDDSPANVNYMNLTDLDYIYEDGNTISSNVCHDSVPNPYGISVKTGSDGKATVDINTHKNTKAATYTIRVQKPDGINILYETVKVKIEKGALTILEPKQEGPQYFFIGDEITISGINTASDYVYLFITGPYVISSLDDLSVTSVSDNEDTFAKVKVNSDNTWSYKFKTTEQIQPGTYTIYAVSKPKNKSDLGEAKYDTVSIVFSGTFTSAATSASTIERGDEFQIHGKTSWKISKPIGIRVWIFGDDYWNGATTPMEYSTIKTANVNNDGIFEYILESDETEKLANGEYFVVLEHFSFFSGLFGTKLQAIEGEVSVINSETGEEQFVVWGDNKLQGSEAAEAFKQAALSAGLNERHLFTLSFFVEDSLAPTPTITPTATATATPTPIITATQTITPAPTYDLKSDVEELEKKTDELEEKTLNLEERLTKQETLVEMIMNYFHSLFG